VTEEFKTLLKKTYDQYKDHENPPIPLNEIKEYLELEGVELEETKGG